MRTISNPAPLPSRAQSAASSSKLPPWKSVAALSDELSSAVFACEEAFAEQTKERASEPREEQDKPIETLEEFYAWYARLEEQQSKEEIHCDERLLAARRQVQRTKGKKKKKSAC